MKKFSEFICKHRWLIVVLSGLLIIPAIFGYAATRVNYDLLVYLPSDIETLKGQEILTEDFGTGAFSVAVGQFRWIFCQAKCARKRYEMIRS